ncbi:MAG: hypothetical protein HYZ14_05330 [Bacteroidetes bacterium]|nr:hypothetical protein [Bacteroidota bacterium]
MFARDYQNIIAQLLQSKLSGLEVRNEWAAFSGLPYQYCPKVDIAVGPFSTTPGADRINEYNNLLLSTTIKAFLEKVYACHLENIGDEYLNEIDVSPLQNLSLKNQNARCFLAFEIENKNTKKHIMGSMINAASLGRIGIGVAYNDSVMRTFLRILNYLAFLKRVEKSTYDTANFLIVTQQQLLELLEEEVLLLFKTKTFNSLKKLQTIR